MADLAGTGGEVAVGFELLGEGDGVLQRIVGAELPVVHVIAGGVRGDSGQQGDAGRAAKGGRAIGAEEGRSSRGKAIEVGGQAFGGECETRGEAMERRGEARTRRKALQNRCISAGTEVRVATVEP